MIKKFQVIIFCVIGIIATRAWSFANGYKEAKWDMSKEEVEETLGESLSLSYNNEAPIAEPGVSNVLYSIWGLNEREELDYFSDRPFKEYYSNSTNGDSFIFYQDKLYLVHLKINASADAIERKLKSEHGDGKTFNLSYTDGDEDEVKSLVYQWNSRDDGILLVEVRIYLPDSGGITGGNYVVYFSQKAAREIRKEAHANLSKLKAGETQNEENEINRVE